MSLSPTTGMSRLSLEAVPPSNTILQHKMQSQSRTTSSPLESEEDYESEWDEDEETGNVLSSPSGLKYNTTNLSPKTQRVVKEMFNQQATEPPPQISLELCGIKEESEDDGIFYAFQLHEIVPCSVRLGSKHSKRFSKPKCECPDARYRNARPCKHLVWLFDRISKQTLFDHDPEAELTLTEYGYAQELGDPFQQVSDIRLDVLAEGLHCDVAAPNCDTAPPSRSRLREARELLAAIVGVESNELETYRTDLETSHNSSALIRRGDLEATFFSLLLASHSLATWVRQEIQPPEPVIDPFRAQHQRVLRIISELDAYSSSLQDAEALQARRIEGKEAEGPRNVSWAAAQIQHCVRRIEKLIGRGASPLTAWERSSAARALVGILKAVVNHNIESHGGNTTDDRNLFMLLVGNHDTGFVFSALDMLVDQSQFIEELEDIMDLLGRFGAPASYAANMRSLITRMRSFKGGWDVNSGNRSAGGSVGTDSGGGTHRSNTPVLDEPAPGEHSPPSKSASAPTSVSDSPSGAPSTATADDGLFLTPELPASATRRGNPRGRAGPANSRGRGRGRGLTSNPSSTAGAKRSVSGGGQDRGRGSKRAR
ncbi:hypothetical protein V8F06_001371 [Rhypophila decipiens]